MEIPVQMLENQANIAATTGMNTTDNIVQTSVKQRKVSKIIVLFDDGSYQEMLNALIFLLYLYSA
jgi:hypothetical protein